MKKHWIVFLIGVLVLSLLFFVFPINIFDGAIVYNSGAQEYTVDAPLSLSYFIGIGYEEADMVGVADFYLYPKGILMAFLFIFGFPALLVFKIYTRQK